MGKSIHPVSVLRPVDKANNPLTPAVATTSADSGSVATCELSVSSAALRAVRAQLEQLYTANSPDIHTRVLAYLDADHGPDYELITAWARYGRRDRQRTVDIRLNEVAKRTISPLGFACLIAYARAWVDEAEHIDADLRTRAGLCVGRAGSATKGPLAGSTRQPLARVAVASKRRKRPA
jgi:hypothetical protein